jgi:hypothetical protein
VEVICRDRTGGLDEREPALPEPEAAGQPDPAGK